MRKRTKDSFPAVVGGGLIILALFLHSIYEDLLKAAVLKRLSEVMGIAEAELVSRLTEMTGPIVGAVAVIWVVLWYARRELRWRQKVTGRLWEMADMVKVLEDWETSETG